MDLDRCPKCGVAWAGGDKCRKCGFVPIGAGLDKLPKKKKRRARRYVEPGSSGPFLSFVFLVLAGYGTIQFRPWEDDWEKVRALFGQGRRHSIVGKWQVVKSVQVKKSKENLVAGRRVQRGRLVFSKSGAVEMSLENGKGKVEAAGQYLVSGQLLAINRVVMGADSTSPLPDRFKLQLAWTGPDAVVASTGNEAIYLQRITDKNPVHNLIALDAKVSKDQVPGQMRGVIAGLQNSVNEASGSDQ